MSYQRKEVRGTARSDFKPDWAELFQSRLPDVSDREGCWIWQGTVNGQGRPTFAVDQGQRKVSASRYAYWLANGTIPDGTVICHRCDEPLCVNPAHLFAGTQAENLADMTAKGRRARVGLSGGAHPNARLSDADAANIAGELAGGASATVLARKHGVTRSAIYRAAKRGAK